jgi:hypothetical protein
MIYLRKGKTAYNRIVYASPLRGSGYTKHQSGYALCGVLFRHIFGVAGTASQFLYRNPKNVVYNFYVICHLPQDFFEIYLTLMAYSSTIWIWQIFFCLNLSVSPCHPWHGDFDVLSCGYIKGVNIMRNWKHCALIGMVAIIVFCFAFAGCKPEPDPEPQTKTLSNVSVSNGSVTVKINYMAKPGEEPDYMTKLVEAIRKIFTSYAITNASTVTINVTTNGSDGFSKTATRTFSVGGAWLSSAQPDDIELSLFINGPGLNS